MLWGSMALCEVLPGCLVGQRDRENLRSHGGQASLLRICSVGHEPYEIGDITIVRSLRGNGTRGMSSCISTATVQLDHGCVARLELCLSGNRYFTPLKTAFRLVLSFLNEEVLPLGMEDLVACYDTPRKAKAF